MRKQSTRTSLRTAGLGLLLLGVIVALPSQPVQATDCATLPPPTSIEVTKTASLTAGAVEGTISITNVGKNPACISLIIDTLEVHFPESSKWVQVALVPGLQAIPNPIPVGQTVVIDYNFDTCDANDYTGANSMRNVVKVTLANGAKGQKTVTTRSDSFAPPSQASCCGNGVVNQGEECDDGNTVSGDCCSSTCEFETGLCNDGNACTYSDQCSSGTCVGTAITCTDDQCNTRTCNGTSSCTVTPKTGPCDDGNACTTTDTCSGGACVGGPSLNCDDGNGCTTDSCNAASGCAHTPITSCVNSDGCCPTGCNANNDNNCTPVCGNGVVESGEQCDGTNLNGKTCSTACPGVLFGTLHCHSNCTFDCTNCFSD